MREPGDQVQQGVVQPAVGGQGAWAVPAGAAGLLASKAIAVDLRKAGRILASRTGE